MRLTMVIDLARYHDAVDVNVEKIMNPDVIVIRADQPCKAAVEIFLHKRVGSLPVVDNDGRLIGILSESDLMLPANVDRDVGDILTPGCADRTRRVYGCQGDPRVPVEAHPLYSCCR